MFLLARHVLDTVLLIHSASGASLLKKCLNDTNRDSLHCSSISQQYRQIVHDICSVCLCVCVCVCVHCWLMMGSSVNDLIILKPVMLCAVTSSDIVERQDIPSPEHMQADVISLTYTCVQLTMYNQSMFNPGTD